MINNMCEEQPVFFFFLEQSVKAFKAGVYSPGQNILSK